MKRTFIALVVGLLVAAAAGCGGSSTESSIESGSPSPSATPSASEDEAADSIRSQFVWVSVELSAQDAVARLHQRLHPDLRYSLEQCTEAWVGSSGGDEVVVAAVDWSSLRSAPEWQMTEGPLADAELRGDVYVASTKAPGLIEGEVAFAVINGAAFFVDACGGGTPEKRQLGQETSGADSGQAEMSPGERARSLGVENLLTEDDFFAFSARPMTDDRMGLDVWDGVCAPAADVSLPQRYGESDAVAFVRDTYGDVTVVLQVGWGNGVGHGTGSADAAQNCGDGEVQREDGQWYLYNFVADTAPRIGSGPSGAVGFSAFSSRGDGQGGDGKWSVVSWYYKDVEIVLHEFAAGMNASPEYRDQWVVSLPALAQLIDARLTS